MICIYHFSEQFIVREDQVVRDDGSILIVPREKPKLTVDAIPSNFPNIISQHIYQVNLH